MGETPESNTPPLNRDGSYRMRRGPNPGALAAMLVAVVVIGLVVLAGFAAFRDDGAAASPSPASSAASASATSTADPSLIDPGDVAFLTILQQRGVAYDDPAAAIDAAHTTCTFLAKGGTQAQAGLLAMQYGHYSAADAGTIVGAATGAYCPQYNGTFGS